jgi:hypothetical protein
MQSHETTKIAKITWLDSSQMRGWVDKDALEPIIETVDSIGFVVKETDDFISISNSISEYQVNSPLTIPKFAIKEIEYV